MKNLHPAFLLLALAVACGDDHGSGTTEVISVRLDDASEEMMLTIRDRVQQGDVAVDAELAPALSAPADDAVLSRTEPPTFTWALPSARPRHGISDGDFVWLELSGGGLEKDIGVIAITTTSWTPDGEAWTALAATTGPVTIRVTGATGVNGLVEGTPLRASADGTEVTFGP